MSEQFPGAQTEIQKVLNGIFVSIQNKDADKLISYHVYDPKFTEFRDGEYGTDAAGNEANERTFVEAISVFD